MAPSRAETRRRQVSTASNISHHISDYHRHSSAASQAPTRSECHKHIRDLNRELARYAGLSFGLGGWRDGDNLRSELRRSQQKVHQLATHTRLSLLQLLRGASRAKEEEEPGEKMWHTFTCCLELFAVQLQRSLSLQTSFPLHTSVSVLIHTGVSEAAVGRKSSSAAQSLLALESQEDRARRETADRTALSREVQDIKNMVEDANQAVSIQPWTFEPEYDIQQMESKHSLASLDASMMEITVYDGDRQRRRKCICIVLAVTVVIVIVATVAGILFAVRHSNNPT